MYRYYYCVLEDINRHTLKGTPSYDHNFPMNLRVFTALHRTVCFIQRSCKFSKWCIDPWSDPFLYRWSYHWPPIDSWATHLYILESHIHDPPDKRACIRHELAYPRNFISKWKKTWNVQKRSFSFSGRLSGLKCLSRLGQFVKLILIQSFHS